MAYQDAEREFVELVIEKIDGALESTPETKFEHAIAGVVVAVTRASERMMAVPEVEEAFGALRDAVADIQARLDEAVSEDEARAVWREVPMAKSPSAVGEWSFLRQIAHDYARDGVFHAALKQALRDVPKRVDRVEEVLDLLVDARLSERSRRYVSKTAKLFIAGFRLEAVILARASLESALSEVVPDAVVRDTLQLPKKRFVGLAERIEASERIRRLDAEAAALARKIADAANTVLHEEPRFPEGDHSAKSYLGELRDVLVALDRNL